MHKLRVLLSNFCGVYGIPSSVYHNLMFYRFLFIVLGFAILSTSASAQNNIYFDKLKEFESVVQRDKLDFRLVMSKEDFPERVNATLPLNVTTNPSLSVVTLHDANSGEPIENCLSPCELMRQKGRDYVVTAFKVGFIPRLMGTRSGSSAKNGSLAIDLGLNLFKTMQEHVTCRKAFLAKEKVDGDAQPCFRFPAPMPRNAKTSGHCKMKFDLTEMGKAKNIEAVSCTNKIFEAPSRFAIGWWMYNPKVDRGVPVPQLALETTMTFRLQDEEGNLIPEPDAP